MQSTSPRACRTFSFYFLTGQMSFVFSSMWVIERVLDVILVVRSGCKIGSSVGKVGTSLHISMKAAHIFCLSFPKHIVAIRNY